MMAAINARGGGEYTLGEEIVHTLTHGAGALLSIPAILFLIAKATSVGAPLDVAAVSLYGGCMFLMFASSTLYHGAFRSPLRSLFKMFDHAAIYLLIAGTYTPFALVTLPQSAGVPLLVLVWCAAMTGIGFKLTAFLRKWDKNTGWLSLALYLAMGWAAVFVVGHLVELLPPAGFGWLVAGGLCFTVGAAIYAMKSLRYTHAVWHLLVMAGVTCHFVAVYGYVL